MSRKRKHVDDDLEPTEKLISDGDLLVEKLLQKQLSKRSDLQTEFQRKKMFISSTEYKPVSNYVSGIKSLNELMNTSKYIQTLEDFTAAGLCEEDIQFYLDIEKGLDYLKLKHKNLDPELIEKKLLTLNSIISKYQNTKNMENSPYTVGRQSTECMLSIKPNSIETNLLKFALSNEKKNEEPHKQMDPLRIIANDFMNSLNDQLDENIDISKRQKKIQRRLRAMSSRIDAMILPSQKHTSEAPGLAIVKHSKWDLKYVESEPKSSKQNSNEIEAPDTSNSGAKSNDKNELFPPRSQISGNRYTIIDGTIIKLENVINYTECRKLSVEEILNIPKFSQYNPGLPTKILYLKNVHSLSQNDVKLLFKAFNFQIKAVNVMKGRMKGQAFVEMENCQLAEQALICINGIIVKNKPVIIQFSKRSELL